MRFTDRGRNRSKNEESAQKLASRNLTEVDLKETGEGLCDMKMERWFVGVGTEWPAPP